MSLKEKIKRKLIHLCGGYCNEDIPFLERKVNIVKTECPLEHIQFNFKHYVGETPMDVINMEAARKLADYIIQHHLYNKRTEIDIENPKMLTSYYSIYVANKP